MFKKEDVIKYIIENIRSKTREEICNFLDIHKKTLTSIMKKNNILDDRIFRYCPECFEKITHIDITNRLRCERQNKKCNKCEGKLRSVRYSGEDNPFYGKSHNESTISILKHNHKGKRYSIKTEFKKGNTNRKDGLSNYNLWLVKFGKEVADQNMDSFKKKLSIANSGENNPMFGIPSPIGSGCGWSGWYKGWYFRSLLELSYMILVIERFNLNWEKAESIKYKIEYKINNIERNYFADFIINDKYLIECKSKKLQLSVINKAKFEAAIDFCHKKNLIFKIVDCYKIKPKELKEIYKNGNIKFIKKYEIKINNMIEKDKFKI